MGSCEDERVLLTREMLVKVIEQGSGKMMLV